MTSLISAHSEHHESRFIERKSTEASPPLDVISRRPDLYGNTHRVGHDIMADWHSILSMVDIASNLWQWAHNDTGLGGFYNDMDVSAGTAPRSLLLLVRLRLTHLLAGCRCWRLGIRATSRTTWT